MRNLLFSMFVFGVMMTSDASAGIKIKCIPEIRSWVSDLSYQFARKDLISFYATPAEDTYESKCNACKEKIDQMISAKTFHGAEVLVIEKK